jgi:release factor glutamine methyltransferase
VDAPGTVGEVLQHARQALGAVSQTPGLDAQLLLADCLRTTRSWILAHPEALVNGDGGRAFQEALQRCLSGEALPHVLGWWEFYGRRFQLGRQVLIPRPETELLVEEGLAYLRVNPSRRLALDVGTGSGCIGVTLAAETADLRVFATDRGTAPLRAARGNAARHGVAARVTFVQADLAAPLAGPFDLIAANLPYVPEETLDELDVARREPRLALDGGPGGLGLLRRMIDSLPHVLAAGGRALLEIGAGQGSAVVGLAHAALPTAQVSLRSDLAGFDRLLVVERRP